MSEATHTDVTIVAAARRYWREQASVRGPFPATTALLGAVWEFLRDSTPSRLRQRFGDADYDWDFRVNTTSGAVGWRERLLGNFYSAYQPTEPAAFDEMMAALLAQRDLDLSEFTFMDLGSGKGRTLLMASEYPFQRILGIELLPALNRIACENIQKYKSDSQQCFDLESICADATRFPIPEGPALIYMFNPFPEVPVRSVVRNIENVLSANWRPIYVLYHNPQIEHLLVASNSLRKVSATDQYSIFAAVR